MFWYVMLMLFSPLYLMFGLVFRNEQCVCRAALGPPWQSLVGDHSAACTWAPA
jgi:hypothetical protein